MRYIPVSCEQREAMLRAAGVSSIDELFADVPSAARLDRPLDLPPQMSEIELVAHLRGMAKSNTSTADVVSFAGAGCYDHHVPSVVDHVLTRPEFFTAYTPYQPEVSQGTLQAIFEYQSAVCELTGMDVSNASMYDGATSLVEAALMACRVTKRHVVLCSPAVHPEWRETLTTYSKAGTFAIESDLAVTEAAGGACDLAALSSRLERGDVAAVLVQSPGFLGTLEDIAALSEVAHAAGVLLVVAVNPILLGVVEAPGVLGADIVVGEGQSLGNAQSFGGPGLGFFACRQAHVRQMPGRLVGRTTDVDGAAAFVLTLSTREQHIRRERATSNICSNHALNAVAAGIYLVAVGREGLEGIARACVSKAQYLRDRLLATGRFEAPWEAPFGYEFALRYSGDVGLMQGGMLESGFLAGVDVTAIAGEWIGGVNTDGLVLFAVTEKRTRAELDAFVEAVMSL